MDEVLLLQDEEERNGEGGGGGGRGGRVLLKKGPWTAAEDAILVAYVEKHGEGNWNSLQKHSGLSRCGKSCRLRWANHLRPNLKKGAFTMDEERLIIQLHAKLGNKWARMAAQLPGRTDNEIKNYWNTRIKRRQRAGLPVYPPEVQSMHLLSPYVHSQGDATSVSSNTDSDGDALPSPKGQIPSLNHAMGGFSLPVVLCDIPLNAVPDNALIVPSPSVTEPLQAFSSPSESNCYLTEYKAMPFSQLSDAMTKCFELHHPKPHCKPALDSMLARGFPLEPDPGIDFQFPGVQPNYHGFASGSYSCFGLDSSLKQELPSGQSVEAAGSAGADASALISPFTPLSSSKILPSEAHTFEHVSNSGLLESLLQEAEAKQWNSHFTSQPKDLSSVQTLDDHTSANKTLRIEDSNAGTRFVSYAATAAIQPISSTQVYNWKNTSSSRPTLKPVIKLEESSGGLSWAYSDLESSTSPNYISLYEMGVSEWDDGPAPYAAETFAQPVAAEPENSSSSGLHSGNYRAGPTVAGHVLELGSCQWNNMPGACLIGDFAADWRPSIAATQHSVDTGAIF
ncbi:hypothetical protein O6H91_07G100600 [Diphasiastrum complanatum]|uniref:Uncharacterized protein n=1 Tax=Diphasiastrum complanatum TaxID=34168 RepID=A0ACC2D8E5_DIPCM|nr:hypothetical protein O6H91_07G100600 [Diphasiastrum complanatum]